MDKKIELTENQQKIIDTIMDEFARINQPVTRSINKMKHYFLFGESAVNIYGEDGVDALVEQNEEEYLGSTEVFVFEDGITSPADLLCAFNGYGDYSCITEEEYEKLKDCF